MTTLSALIFVEVWFVLSVSIEVRSRAVFWFYLEERIEGLNPFMSIVPGYLERNYVRWCKSPGESGRRKIWTRYTLTANAIVSGICAAVLLGMLVFK